MVEHSGRVPALMDNGEGEGGLKGAAGLVHYLIVLR
jgi:hypothetical protein